MLDGRDIVDDVVTDCKTKGLLCYSSSITAIPRTVQDA